MHEKQRWVDVHLLEYINDYLNALGSLKCLVVTLVASLFLGILDYLIGPDISFSVFYIIPIMLATWYGGKGAGLILAVVSAGIWLSADLAASSEYTSLLIPSWNTLVRLIFFVIIWRLLIIVHEHLTLEESLADTDPLTNLANRRFFQEQLDRELLRAHRHPEPFTIAYFDLDNFKYVNDTLGHNAGDELLQVVANKLSISIRATDFAARLGGDEFAVLFPVLDKETAKSVLEKLQVELLDAMKEKSWPVTFSIGVATFSKPMETSRDMIKTVDDLMYDVKKSGKNNIRHIVWPTPD